MTKNTIGTILVPVIIAVVIVLLASSLISASAQKTLLDEARESGVIKDELEMMRNATSLESATETEKKSMSEADAEQVRLTKQQVIDGIHEVKDGDRTIPVKIDEDRFQLMVAIKSVLYEVVESGEELPEGVSHSNTAWMIFDEMMKDDVNESWYASPGHVKSRLKDVKERLAVEQEDKGIFGMLGGLFN